MSTHATELHQNFIYQFKVEDEIAYAGQLMDGVRSSAECNIVDVIYESFVVTADQDYLTARLLAQSGLFRAFYWAAAQTVEKYLKAFLLLRGESVKSRSHGIVALYEKASVLDAALKGMDISPHVDLSIPEHASTHITLFSVSDFLLEIEKFGRPDNRYNSFGVDFDSGHLLALDHFVHGFREKLGVPDIWQSMNKVDVNLLDAFKRNNPWFSKGVHGLPDSENPPVSMRSSIAVTTLDLLVAQIKNPSCKLALQWLNKMMQLPVELRHRIDKI